MNAGLAWLAESTVSVSLVIALLLVARRRVARHFGAATAYRLWLLVPAHLAVPALFPDHLDLFVLELAPLTLHSGNAAETNAALLPSPWVLLAWVWAAGAIVSIYRLARAVAFARRLVRQSTPAGPGLEALLASACLDPRRVRRSRHVASPTVAGFLGPVLLLPREFPDRFGPRGARLVLAHEACHMQRRDNLATAAAWFCTAVFWLNPLVHSAFRAFRADQELSCDARVLRHADNGERKEYGRALVESAAANGPAAVTSSWQDLNHLKERTMMLGSHRHSPARSLAGLALVAGLALAAAGFSINAVALEKTSHKADALDAGPVLVEHARPRYPAGAAKEKIEGRVVMQFTVDTEGHVRDVSVIKSEPGKLFDDAAIAALEQWRFEPARKNGQPVPVQVQQAIEFELD